MFSELRQQAASEVKAALGTLMAYTPVGTLDTREVSGIVHEARADSDKLSQQITRVTLFMDEVPDGKVGDALVAAETGERYVLDSVSSRTPTRTVWAVKKARAR